MDRFATFMTAVAMVACAATARADDGQVNDGFESASSFGTMRVGDTGGWLFLDCDGGPSGYMEGVSLPNHNAGGPESFIVFDDHGFGDVYGARSGHKMLCVFYNLDGSANDDWAISPRLSGRGQTVTFHARSMTDQFTEHVEALYSLSGRNPEDFVRAAVFDNISTDRTATVWGSYRFDVPDGSRYFALRYVSQDQFMLYVDDVVYEPGSLAVDAVGYNPGPKVSVLVNGGLEVFGAADVSVGDMLGREVYRGGCGVVYLPAGLYVVVADGRAVKALVK